MALALAALYCPAVSYADCPGGYLTSCGCPSGCNSDSCEKFCDWLITGTDGSCIYRCDPCECQGVGAESPETKWSFLAGIFAQPAYAQETRPGVRSYSNEDGDFLVVEPKEAAKAAKEDAGIGVTVVNSSSGAVVVGSLLQNGPASKAGLKTGDEILTIDGRKCAGLKLNEVSRALRGPSGSLVILRVLTKSTGKIKKISFNRLPFSALGPSKKSGVTIKEVPLTQFGDRCPTEDSGCHFLYKKAGICTFTCHGQRRRRERH